MANIIRKRRFNLGIPIKLYARLEKCAEHQEITVTALILQFIRVGVSTIEKMVREQPITLNMKNRK